MSETTASRRLAAILAADVVGYSRMMSADEDATLSALKRHRDGVFEPAVARNNGRTFKLIGDGTLVEFSSVVDAVRCAIDIQSQIAAEAPSDGVPHIVLRIGVNLGDVILDGDDVYGDGVNIAARLEPLADHGGVCVSSIVKESVGDRLGIDFRDGGEAQVKNIARPLRVWRWSPGETAAIPVPEEDGEEGGPSEATKSSIAVLPFDNMSGDPEQEYFSDGISEDIITDLSKVGGLIVIARNSSFAYKGKAVDLRQVGRELGVTSVLEGSIRRAGNRVRITAQLIDAKDGSHIWAERFDRDLTDIFEVQDEVTLRIVEALKVALTPDEEKRLAATPTANSEAHDLFLRGREMLANAIGNREEFEKATALFEQSLAADPDYGAAMAGLAMTHAFDYVNGWSNTTEKSIELALDYGARAVAAAPDDPFAHYAHSVALAINKETERAYEATKKSLELNPNFAPAYNTMGVYKILNGDPAASLPLIEKAIRLDPGSGQQYFHFLGMAHALLGNFEMAATAFRERILLFPGTDLTRALLAATLGHLGEIDEARKVWSELEALDTSYDFERHMRRLNFADPEDAGVFREGLEKAGLPPTKD